MEYIPSWRFAPNGSPDVWLMLDDVLYTLLALAVVAITAVVVALSRNVYRTTLRTHALRSNFSEQHMKRSDRIFLKSMEAETIIEDILREEGWEHVFLRRRVPISRVGHNREIDVVAVGPVVLVVEVKHWQGYVWSNGSRWYQKPGPQTLEFEDVEEDNVVKAAALRRHLENTRHVCLPDFELLQQQQRDADEGKSVDDTAEEAQGTWYSDRSLHKRCGQCIVPIVVFTNKRVKLDPATVKAKKYVFTLETFRTFAREALRGNVCVDGAPSRGGAASAWLRKVGSIIPYGIRRLASSGPSSTSHDGRKLLDVDTQDNVAYAVNVLRTWDLVYLHDGSLVTGDVQKIDMPNAHCMYERKHLLDVDLHWNTGIIGMIKTFMLNKAGTVELVLVTAKRLAKKKKEKKPRNAEGNIVFPILPKRIKNMNLNDRLVIKPAGNTKLQTHALVDIREVRLSQHLYESEKHL